MSLNQKILFTELEIITEYINLAQKFLNMISYSGHLRDKSLSHNSILF